MADEKAKPDAKEPASSKSMRVFLMRTYCDENNKRHAMHTMCTLPEKEVMGKHPSTGKNLLKMGVAKREEDYDPDTDPKIQKDEDEIAE